MNPFYSFIVLVMILFMNDATQTPRKGRASQTNASGRFERVTRHGFDDGWPARDDDAPPPLRTSVAPDRSRSIIARNQSPDIGFDRSINPYRGCEHGCIYCFARPTHAWLGLSAGLDFETRLFAKHDAAALLRRELSRPKYKPAVIAIGTNTDPYQPVERRLGIMRAILEALQEARHPVAITTKSDAIVRDLDILSEMGSASLAHATISVTTLDRTIARTLEPRAASPDRRLIAIERLAAAGVPTAVNIAPVVPGLTDHEMEDILAAAAARGAQYARFIPLRLPLEVKDLFVEWLDAYAPDRKNKVLNIVRSMRGGKLNEAAFGKRMKGRGPYAQMIESRFRLAAARHGLDRREEEDWLRTDLFRPPAENPDQFTLNL